MDGGEKAFSFATRCNWETDETEWARLLRERRTRGESVLDLTASNPTRCGFGYDAAALLEPLRAPAALDYDPDPRGMLRAREAVVRYYLEHVPPNAHLPLMPEQIFLTTGTSEAYSFLFRLLCNPGDEVLVPQPSYPLFEFLATIDDVQLRPYPLFYDYGWHLDGYALEQRITPRTRAILVVHPNNPTGHYTKTAERALLEQICTAHGLALIVDEVFLDYPVGHGTESPAAQTFVAGAHPALTFVLSGVSKVVGLPQMKAAWLACCGPDPVLQGATSRLEVIADTFLSMNAPVQHALPAWLGQRDALQQQILARVAGNLEELDRQMGQQTAVTRLVVEGGWYAVLRIPALRPDEEVALALLGEAGVAVHAGVSFGLPEAGWLVVSLLGAAAEFREGVGRLLAALGMRSPGRPGNARAGSAAEGTG